MFVFIAVLGEQSRVESDLQARSDAELTREGLTWASTQFRGREATVLGRASEESEKSRAASTVAKVWGVSAVVDRTDLLELQRNYVWSAALGDRELQLSGFVPNEAARKTILGAAKSAFPTRPVVDGMKLARGAPDQGQWLGGVSFALKQLAGLKPGGRVALDGTAISLAGESESANSYRSVKAAISSGRPQGIALKEDGVVAPVVKPYTWAARWNGRQVELSGHVPSEAQRAEVLEQVKKALPKATVADRMAIGSGEPGGWLRVVASTIGKLGQLIEGSADLRDTQLSIGGLAEREPAVDAIRAALKSEIQAPFRYTEQIRQDPRVKAQEEEARRKAEEEARRAAAAAAAKEAEARRQVELERQRSTAEAAAQSDEARRKAAEDALRQKAAEEAQKRAAAEAAQRLRAEADRCQTTLRSTAADGAINFQRASAEIEKRSFPTLNKLAEVAKGCPAFQIEVAGHTDAEGEPERNQRLSERRAQSVVDYLLKAGIEPSRLVAVGFGQSQPVAPNDTAENRARNRRIEFNVKAR